MDKEAQERVAGCISANFNSTVSDMDIAAKVLSLLEELGYRKLPGEDDDGRKGTKLPDIGEEPEWEKTYRVERAARDKVMASKFTEDGHRKYDR